MSGQALDRDDPEADLGESLPQLPVIEQRAGCAVTAIAGEECFDLHRGTEQESVQASSSCRSLGFEGQLEVVKHVASAVENLWLVVLANAKGQPAPQS